MRPVQPGSQSGSSDWEPDASGSKRTLYALLPTVFIALVVFGVPQLAGWGTAVPQPINPEPPAIPSEPPP